MPEALIVVPTFNEIESLESIIRRIRVAAPAADILVVDDSSPDGTGQLADALAASDPRVSVLHRTTKDGLGRAYLAGFAIALAKGYDYVVEIDADGSHDPAELPAMLGIARGGADLVIGSRRVPGGSVHNWSWMRQAISKVGNWYARTVLRSRIHDLTAGYRVYRTSALRDLALTNVASQGYCFQVELAWLLELSGHTIKEHPIAFEERATGRSKMGSGIVVEALMRITWWGLTRGTRRPTSPVTLV
ncbi:MAG: dolichol-phosphate mannosyltransferase [Actinomycetota bacterium]|nr:dolichol-phosphate mannosyltransferase [Actinomycetota bacterium]